MREALYSEVLQATVRNGAGREMLGALAGIQEDQHVADES
jgi:hypothetical protein